MKSIDQLEHSYTHFWDHNSKRIIECETCGFKHFYPIPSKEEIDEFYHINYYKNIKPFDYSSITNEYVKEKQHKIMDHSGYIEVYDRLMTLLPTSTPNVLKMIDVGGGNKLLAKFFMNKGWHSSVIELSKDACHYLRKFDLNVYHTSIEDLEELPEQNLSFINIEFVMEHLRNPLRFLEIAYDALLPGGILRIRVPNDFNEAQLAYMDYYNEELRWYLYPDHINYFTFDSLSLLLLEKGFREVYRKATFPLEFLLLGGLNYYNNEEDRKKVGPFVQNFEQSFIKTGRKHVLDMLYESLASQGLGRSIEIFVCKE